MGRKSDQTNGSRGSRDCIIPITSMNSLQFHDRLPKYRCKKKGTWYLVLPHLTYDISWYLSMDAWVRLATAIFTSRHVFTYRSHAARAVNVAGKSYPTYYTRIIRAWWRKPRNASFLLLGLYTMRENLMERQKMEILLARLYVPGMHHRYSVTLHQNVTERADTSNYRSCCAFCALMLLMHNH